MKPHYQLTIALSATQLETFGEAVGFQCIGYPKVVRAALVGLMETLQRQNPDLLPGFKEWADDLYAYTTRATASGDMIAHRIGMAEPIWTGEPKRPEPSATLTEGSADSRRKSEKAAWEATMKRLGIKPKGPLQ